MKGQIESLLDKGIEAARAKEKQRARDILLHVIELDERNEQAWLWLSSVVETPADKAVCLENALLVNPDNTYAAMGLQHLRRQDLSSQPSILPRLGSPQTSAERRGPALAEAVEPPPNERICKKCGFRNPGWAYLCDRCGNNLRRVDVREAVRPAAEPRPRSFFTLLDAWGGLFTFNRAYAFRPEIELASWGRSTVALALAAILASAVRILFAALLPVLSSGVYDLRERFARDVPEWAKQTLWLALAMSALWAIATMLTWGSARLLGGKQGVRVHAHLVMVAVTGWTLLSAVVAALVMLTPYVVAGASALDLPFEQVFNYAAIAIGLVGFIWLSQATRTAHDLSFVRGFAVSVIVAGVGAAVLFGLDLLTGGQFTHSVARPLLVFFLPWLGQQP